jgi:hypothetical protein
METLQPLESRILSFDPGETTGISFILDGDFVWGMVSKPMFFGRNSFLQGLIVMSQPNLVIIEKPPLVPKFPNKDQMTVYNRLEKFFSIAGFKVLTPNPGQWKGLVERTDISCTHIKDAADMAKAIYAQKETTT